MNDSAAYSHIDSISARIGNQGFERRWNAFLGQCDSLRCERPALEWLEGPVDEVSLVLDQQRLGAMDFPEKAWSEIYTPHGAGGALEQVGDHLRLVTENYALHTTLGLLRRCWIRNISASTQRIRQFRLDAWALNPKELCILSHHFQQKDTRLSLETHEQAIAVTNEKAGLILGTESGGRFEVFSEAPGCAAIYYPEEIVLLPGASWTGPFTFILPWWGDFSLRLTDGYEGVLRAILNIRTWEQERKTDQ